MSIERKIADLEEMVIQQIILPHSKEVAQSEDFKLLTTDQVERFAYIDGLQIEAGVMFKCCTEFGIDKLRELSDIFLYEEMSVEELIHLVRPTHVLNDDTFLSLVLGLFPQGQDKRIIALTQSVTTLQGENDQLKKMVTALQNENTKESSQLKEQIKGLQTENNTQNTRIE